MNFIDALNIGDLISDIFTLSLVVCLFLHLIFTKNKRLVSLSMALVSIQFLNWLLRPILLAQESVGIIWYITWIITDSLILFYIATMAVTSNHVLKQERDIAFFSLVAIFVVIARFSERHFTDATFVKVLYPYAAQAVNICIIAILLIPLAKGLLHYLGKKLNGITILGLRISVSSVRSSIVLADSESVSRQNRHYL